MASVILSGTPGWLNAPSGVLPSPQLVRATAGFNGVLGLGVYGGTNIEHYVNGITGGGLTQDHYQAFMYSSTVGGDNVGEIWDAAGLGNNYCVISLNRARPLDPARLGVITGTGAAQNVAVPSIILGSQVVVSYVGGAGPLAGPPVITITPNTGFAITLPAGAIYNYEVIG